MGTSATQEQQRFRRRQQITENKSEGHTEAGASAGQPVVEHVQGDLEASEAENQANRDDDIQVARPRRRVKEVRQWAPHVLEFLTLCVLAFQALIFSQRSTWMQQQSKATNDALTESKKSREIENRAYVGVVEVVLDKPIRGRGEQLTARLEAVNTGRTPAVNFKSQVWGGTTPPNASLPLTPPGTSPSGGQGILMPGRTWNTTATTQLSRQEKIAFSETGSRLYVWGSFEYDDFFGAHHTSQFCFVNESSTSADFVPCAGGNWMN